MRSCHTETTNGACRIITAITDSMFESGSNYRPFHEAILEAIIQEEPTVRALIHSLGTAFFSCVIRTMQHCINVLEGDEDRTRKGKKTEHLI